MTLLDSLWCVGAVAGMAVLSLVACSTTESLGSKNASGGSDGGGVDGSGGATATGGRTAATGGRTTATGGRSAGGTASTGGSVATGGTPATGGAPNDCSGVRNCPNEPAECNGSDLLLQGDDCCYHCVDPSTLPPAACIIGGVRYEHLDVVSRSNCSSCSCVDGHIGHCTGVACGPDSIDAGPDLSLPTCPEGQALIEGCADCGGAFYCKAYEFKCRRVGTCNLDGGGFCGAEDTCYKGACISAAESCL
jgi:hypothetical protein